jgi:hypothetical protein
VKVKVGIEEIQSRGIEIDGSFASVREFEFQIG